ncbi:TonB-dependent receptor [Sandaracinobacter sp. RS1-74]|uniref:TonB-dependent receptor n=1 Tax=Sandaracinobacteroides sayramensis TaxID=2913411 RepID=UPI001EDA204D|nr:TonB-dependent receptor [Sandaracinobacteroides sayramensis]MCG2842021.1 TonB-dependent receptor [Sandaracinobacteroides sayramensis]
MTFRILSRAMAALLASSAMPAWAQQGTAPEAASDGGQLEEILVTARRRTETLQDVPVAVTALSASTLQTRGVRTEADLQLAIPGLIIRSGNNNNQLNFVMRGESVDAYSGSPPGVQPYVNEVPYPVSASTPLYDLQSVQAVKGPQGTLFGRNSTGGAVLFQTQEPGEDFGGYASIQYGNYDRLITDGAVDLPISEDQVLLRLAGTATSGGAFVRNLYDGRMLGDKQERSGRVTLAVKPTDSISNILMVQAGMTTGTNAPNTAFYAIPCGDPSGFNSCTYSPDNQPFFSDLLAGRIFANYPTGFVYPGGFETLPEFQRSQGKHVVNQNADFGLRARSDMVVNRTTVDLTDNISLKNIFGYSYSKTRIHYDTDYSPYPFIQQYAPDAVLTGEDLPIETVATKTFSNELQLQGKSADDRLTWLVGLFYIDSTEDYFSPLWLSAINASVAYDARTGNKSTAVFAQATYKLTDELNFTLGGRYTWEKVTLVQGDRSVFGAGQPQRVRQSDPSWTATLDYRISSDLMIYASTRGSWRRGGFNPFNPPTPEPLTAAEDPGGNFFLPERVRDVEIGAKYDGSAGGVPLRVNLALYNAWVTNIQKTAYVVIAGTASSATINVPESRIRGFELDATLRPASWLTLGGSATYTDAKFTKNESRLFGEPVFYGPFGDVPKFSGNMFADASMPLPGDLGSLNYHVDIYHQSSFYFSNLGGTIQPGTQLPAYTLINMRLGWADMFDSGVSASLFVKNLTNKLYYTGGSAGAQNFSVESAGFGPPRTYGLQLRVDF